MQFIKIWPLASIHLLHSNFDIIYYLCQLQLLHIIDVFFVRFNVTYLNIMWWVVAWSGDSSFELESFIF